MSWAPLTFYEKFEHACILILTALIALIIALSIWNLALEIRLGNWPSPPPVPSATCI